MGRVADHCESDDHLFSIEMMQAVQNHQMLCYRKVQIPPIIENSNLQ
jgi:hypothetical protein